MLASLSLTALASIFNAAIEKYSLPVQPVKKFASKEAAVKRIESVCTEYGLKVQDHNDTVSLVPDNIPDNETVEDAAVETPEESTEVTDPAVEGGETAEEPAVEFRAEPGSTCDLQGLDPVHEYKAALEFTGLTDLQYRVLNAIAHAEHNSTNGATPTERGEVNTWLWGDDLADRTGLTEQQVGGVLSGLIQEELIFVSDIGTREAGVTFSESGFGAWQAVHGQVGTLDRLETPPADAPAAPTASGFKYLTRDELKALADTDPAARAAYRMERRKAARTARKAKKAK